MVTGLCYNPCMNVKILPVYNPAKFGSHAFKLNVEYRNLHRVGYAPQIDDFARHIRNVRQARLNFLANGEPQVKNVIYGSNMTLMWRSCGQEEFV